MTEPLTPPGLTSDLNSWDRLRRPVWLFDPISCRGLYANPPALALWGAASLNELLARDFSKLSPAVRTRTERLAEATAGGEAITERWTFYPNGSPVTVQAVISSVPFGDGVALLFEAAPVDVEESEQRAVEALRHTSSLITLFDPQGAMIFANPAAYSAYGRDNQGFADRFADAAHGADTLAKVLGGQVIADLRQVRTLHGERSHHLDARQVLDPVTGQTSILLSERDVTAQVEAERALTVAHQRAEVAIAKERFLANMSHELRTPLNSVIGFASLLGASDLDPTQSDHVGRIAEGGEALLAIINDVITLSELDGGEVALSAAPFDPVQALIAVMTRIEPQSSAKGLELELEVDADLPALVGDAERLSKVVFEYLANAVKFTDQGSVCVRLEAGMAGEDAVALTVSVIDTGPGLDADLQARLFRRFSPGDDSRQKSVGGTGLGLAIAKELIELMGGAVGVESTPGHGARFWFSLTLPLAQGVEASGEDAMAQGGPLNVLYADDHENNRALVQAVLATQGHRCEVVCDGAQAVIAARGGGYDLILMDIQMPVQDGVSAVLEIRSMGGPHAAVPILALTANTLSEQIETYLAAGMQDCIAKPVNMADLLAKAAHWGAVGQRPAQRSAA